mgnify:CR=1 FL=1
MRTSLIWLPILMLALAVSAPAVSAETPKEPAKDSAKEAAPAKDAVKVKKIEPPNVAEPLADKPELPEKKVVKKKKVAKKKPVVKSDKSSAAVLPVTPAPSPISTAENFNTRVAILSRELERNMERKNHYDTFIVTSFANLNKLSETTSFGRLVSENIIHELQLRKWRVFEVRLTKDIIINETGEFTLSRDIRQLKDKYNIAGIVTGTYSIVGNSVIINARVIDINTGLVISSAQSNMPVDWFSDILTVADGHVKSMKIVSDSSTGARH